MRPITLSGDRMPAAGFHREALDVHDGRGRGMLLEWLRGALDAGVRDARAAQTISSSSGATESHSRHTTSQVAYV